MVFGRSFGSELRDRKIDREGTIHVTLISRVFIHRIDHRRR